MPLMGGLLEEANAVVLRIQGVSVNRAILKMSRTVNAFIYFVLTHMNTIYRVSQEECEILRESVSYVELYRYNPKHLYPKLNGYGDNGQRSLKL